jgi:hypothetical protein
METTLRRFHTRAIEAKADGEPLVAVAIERGALGQIPQDFPPPLSLVEHEPGAVNALVEVEAVLAWFSDEMTHRGEVN